VSLHLYRVVQPYGRHPEEWTVLSELSSAGEAFAAIDALSQQMVRTGAPSDAIAVMVVNENGQPVTRPATH
jgi:hypothetical protein